MKARYWIAVAMVFLMTRAGSAALVWDATFDTDADGVVNLRTDNDDGDGQLMIGGNSGGVQTITTESQTNTLSNKAGRSVGGTLGHTDAFGALYTFTWDFQSITTGQAPEFFAGFTSACIQPWRYRASSASAACRTIQTATPSGGRAVAPNSASAVLPCKRGCTT